MEALTANQNRSRTIHSHWNPRATEPLQAPESTLLRAQGTRSPNSFILSPRSRALACVSNRDHHYGKTADSLRTVDKYTFNVRCGGWTRYQYGVTRHLEPRIAVRLMEIADDLLRIEQNNKMLGEIG